MPPCRENRKVRLKRAKAERLRLAHKHLAPVIYRKRGVSPQYYDVLVSVSPGGMARAKCVPNAKYHAMIAELLRMCAGVTVTLPRELFDPAKENP